MTTQSRLVEDAELGREVRSAQGFAGNHPGSKATHACTKLFRRKWSIGKVAGVSLLGRLVVGIVPQVHSASAATSMSQQMRVSGDDGVIQVAGPSINFGASEGVLPPFEVRLKDEISAASPRYRLIKRAFDLTLVAALAPVALPILAIAGLLIKLTSKGPVIHWSKRVGKDNRIFRMPKLRSLRADAPEVATHLLGGCSAYLTPIGGFLRKTSLDELPQLYSILVGDLSFVGPRPALYNQHDLIALRTERQIHKLVPGLTGWAQVNGRDNLPIPAKVQFDLEYLLKQSFAFDRHIVFVTVFKVLRREGVRH